MSPNRSDRQKAPATRGGARKSTPASRSAKDPGSLEELRRDRDEVVERRQIHRAVKAEFEEAQSRGIGTSEATRRENVHTSESPILSGGDLDADWKRADVGDETVGGSVSTPDQDVVDELGEAAGVEFADDEPLDPEEKILRRDRHRWELNPASSEQFQENQREQDAELELPPQREALTDQSAPPSAAQKAKKPPVKPKAPIGFGRRPAAKNTAGRNTFAKPTAGKRAPTTQRGKHR